MGETARRFLRVSTGEQDEQNQVADVDVHIALKGYGLYEPDVRLNDFSASKGEHVDALESALADMAAGKYTVLVVAHSSRVDRQDRLREWFNRARAAGGRIESAREPGLNITDDFDLGWRIMTEVTSWGNAKYSRDLSQNVKASQSRLRDAGKLVGRPPWGYVSVGTKYDHTIVPTDEGRKYIPEIFSRVIAGESLATIARWLKDETGRPWWPKVLGQMIRCTTYMGHRQDAGGRTILRCEALVDAATFRRAGQSLDSRPKRGPTNTENRAMLAGVLFCAKCEGPMYRVLSGKGASRTAYYRCAGKGPVRRSECRNMIRLAVLDKWFAEAMETIDQPIVETRVIPGHDHSAELEEIRFEMRQLAARDLPDNEFDAEMARLRAERDRLASLPSVPDRVERVPTGKTISEEWQARNTEGRRELMSRYGCQVKALVNREDAAKPLTGLWWDCLAD